MCSPHNLVAGGNASTSIDGELMDTADDDTEAFNETKQIATQRRLFLPQCEPTINGVLPDSDILDPFAALPSKLSRFEEHLIRFYLQQYPKLTYGLSVNLKPHPVSTNFRIALSTPACFQVILARAAMYRLNLTDKNADRVKQACGIAMIQHKGEAIRLIRNAVEQGNLASPTDKDSVIQQREDLIASIISLGTLDKRSGAEQTAATHFAAVRTLLRSNGGPEGIRSPQLSRVMCHFECIYGTKQLSYVWDRQHDFQRIFQDLNSCLKRLWQIAAPPIVQISNMKVIRKSPEMARPPIFSAPAAKIFSLIKRPLPEIKPGTEPSIRETTALVFHATCLLTLALIFIEDPSPRSSAATSSMSDVRPKLEGTSSDDGTNTPYPIDQLSDPSLLQQPLNNHAWILQTYDVSSKHSARIWRAAGFVWILKHVSFAVQLETVKWLRDFFESARPALQKAESIGSRPERTANIKRARTTGRSESDLSSPEPKSRLKPFKLDAFHFSYAA